MTLYFSSTYLPSVTMSLVISVMLAGALADGLEADGLENGRGEDPDFTVLVAQDHSPQPLSLLLRAAHAVQAGDVLSASNEAQEVAIGIKAARQFALGELLSHFHFVEAVQQVVGKLADELAVFALVGVLDEIGPNRPGNRQQLLIGVIDDVPERFG